METKTNFLTLVNQKKTKTVFTHYLNPATNTFVKFGNNYSISPIAIRKDIEYLYTTEKDKDIFKAVSIKTNKVNLYMGKLGNDLSTPNPEIIPTVFISCIHLDGRGIYGMNAECTPKLYKNILDLGKHTYGHDNENFNLFKAWSNSINDATYYIGIKGNEEYRPFKTSNKS